MDAIANTSPKYVFLLSELEHVTEASRFLDAHPTITEEGFICVSFDVEITLELQQRNFPTISAKEYRSLIELPMTMAEVWSDTALKQGVWNSLTYRGVTLSRLYFFPLQAYLMSLVYYADIVEHLSVHFNTATSFVVFRPATQRPSRGFSLENKRIDTLVDVAAHVASVSQREFVLLGQEPSSVAKSYSFEFQRFFFSVLIGMLNALVGVFSPKKKVRIYASEYWHNLSPYLPDLPDAEIVLFDRMEAFRVGLGNIWKSRMHFINFDSLSLRESSESKKFKDKLRHTQRSHVEDTNQSFMLRSISFAPLVQKAVDVLLEDAVTSSIDRVDAAYVLLTQLQPDVVVLRSTMSAQTHFVILASVAKELGIPSLELQHGLEYFGPGSMDRRHSSSYMGVYGHLNRNEMKKTGDTAAVPVVIGSPRFDVYKQTIEAPQPHENLTLLAIAPALIPGLATDSFDVEEYFNWVGRAASSVPGMRVVVKLRPGSYRDSFYTQCIKRSFASVPYVIARGEPLSELYPQADIVTSCYSTAAIEALQCGKPLIYLNFSPAQSMMGEYHFRQYADADAMHIAHTPEEFVRYIQKLAKNPKERARMSECARVYIAQNFAFDGNASTRAAALITDLAQKVPVTSEWSTPL